MRRFLLPLVLVGCGTSAPPPPTLAYSFDDVSAQKKQMLMEAEQLYRADDPEFEAALAELSQDPELAYWLTHMLVRDLKLAWDTAQIDEDRMFRSVLGQRNASVERVLKHFDAMGSRTTECLVSDVVRSEFFQTRAIGVTLLARGGETALPGVEEMARNPDPTVRRLAAQVLGEMGDPVPERAIGLSRSLVEDPDFTVRAEAVKGLARGGEEEGKLLRQILLHDPDPFVQRASATAILAFPDLATAAALVQYMEICVTRGDNSGIDAADASLRRLAGRPQSQGVASWRAWLRSVSGS
jgi:hypothetical protein